MKKKFLIATAIVLLNAVAISIFITVPTFAEEDMDGQYKAYPCFCEGQTYPDPMNCETGVCQIDGDLWACKFSWGVIPCGEVLNPPPSEN